MPDTEQLPLALSLSELPSFNNFVAGGANAEVVNALRNFARGVGDPLIYVYGQPGTGVSHLLQASAHLASESGKKSLYLSLSEPGLTAEILTGLESIDFLYLDDTQNIVADKSWEEALFSLFNQFRDDNKHLLIAAKLSPRQLPIELADLQSRLVGMVAYQLKKLTDAEKSAAIILKAQALGLKLSPGVATFILTRGSRDMRELMHCLQKLDQASMVTKRPVTIPFVKQILAW